MDERRVAAVEEIPESGTLLFTYRVDGEEREAVLLRAGDEVVCWENHCQHWTDVRLDRGDGATMRNGEVVCGRHGATFDVETGECTFGPCEGALLSPVPVTVVDGVVRLADEAHAFVRLGPADRARDLSTSGSRNIGF